MICTTSAEKLPSQAEHALVMTIQGVMQRCTIAALILLHLCSVETSSQGPSLVSVQDPLVIVPGTTKVALAGLNGETLGAGTVESQQALFSGDKRATSLVAQKDKTQVMLASQSDIIALQQHQAHGSLSRRPESRLKKLH